MRELCLAGFKHQDELPDKLIPGFAIGGLVAGGESIDDFWRVVNLACRHLPDDRPHYLMGVGYPLDLVDALLWVWINTIASFPSGQLGLVWHWWIKVR